MGNASIWWEPKGAAKPTKIDLGRPFSDLQVTPVREKRVAGPLSGSQSATQLRYYHRVVATIRFQDYDTLYALESMLNRAKFGVRITVAEDWETAYAAFVSSFPTSDSIAVNPAPWRYYSGLPAEGRRWCLQGPTPRGLYEVATTTTFPSTVSALSTTGGTVDLAADLLNDWSDEDWVLVRDPGFWPCMRIPADEAARQAIKHKGRRVFELELVMDEDLDGLDWLSATPTTAYNGELVDLGDTMTQVIVANGGSAG
jgi:hypothetical protein